MLTVLISILGIILTIFLIIGVHEFGHFITARLLGIKVLRFSLGFGKALFKWQDKKGTEFVLSAIPLGGYVKMLDETEEKVPADELHLAFNRQPLYKKLAVVIAGPLTNFIFAFILYWLLFVIGFTTFIPLIGKITPHSIAAESGLKANQEIISINHKRTHDWNAVTYRLMSNLGEATPVTIITQSLSSSSTQENTLNLKDWKMNDLNPDPLGSLGIEPYQPNIPLIIGILQPNSPASQAGLRLNDKIQYVNHQRIQDWQQLIKLISTHPNETLLFTIQREEKTLKIPVTIGKKGLFHPHGFAGIAPKIKLPPELLQRIQYNPLAAVVPATQEVTEFISLNFNLLGKMLTGKISLQGLGGPITIFESAGNALNNGILPFISFLAFFSIAIGVINIIPIPGLDGGHVLFYVIELIIQRPLSVRTQTLLLKLGMIFLLILMTQAIVNDVMRLF